MKAAQVSIASASVATLQRRSVARTWMPPLPPTCSSYPLSTHTIPKSLIVASAQFRGQPDTAILNLCGIQLPHLIRSILPPSPVESCFPQRHHSDSTQVFPVRSALRSDEHTYE